MTRRERAGVGVAVFGAGAVSADVYADSDVVVSLVFTTSTRGYSLRVFDVDERGRLWFRVGTGEVDGRRYLTAEAACAEVARVDGPGVRFDGLAAAAAAVSRAVESWRVGELGRAV